MEPALDILADIETPIVTYGSFWDRVFASIIDGLVLIPISLIDNYNESTFKSVPLLTITTLIGLLYKPFMEAKYYATLGKKAMGLTIITSNFEKPSLKNILLRDIIDLTTRIALAITSFITFFTSEFESIDSAAGFSVLSNSLTGSLWILLGLSFLTLIDAIFLLTDSKRRALHDRIGQTLVIKKG